MTRPRIAITTGEPAGIGPEIAAIAAGDALDADIVLIGDETLLAARASAAGAPVARARDGAARPARRGLPAGPARRPQRGLCARDARSRDRWRARGALRRDRDGSGAEERDQRRRRRLHRTHRIPGGPSEGAPGGDDAGRGHGPRPAARRTRDDPPAARRGAARAHGRRPAAGDAGAPARPEAALRNRAAAHRGDGTQSPRRRGRTPRTRGDRGHRAGRRAHARAPATPSTARCLPTRCSCRRSCSATTPCWRCSTTRGCRC